METTTLSEAMPAEPPEDRPAAAPAAGSGANAPAPYVFGVAGPLGTEELESVTRALADVVVPLTTAWTELLGRPVDVSIAGVAATPTATIDDDPMNAGMGPGPAAQVVAEVAGEGAFLAVADLGPDLATVAILVPTGLGLGVVDVLLGGTGRPPGERSLSVIDAGLLDTVVPTTFDALRHLADPDRVPAVPEVLRTLEEEELYERLLGGVSLELNVTLAEQSHPLYVLVSGTGARILSGRNANAGSGNGDTQSRRMVTAALSEVLVEAVVTFPPVSVPSQRILRLGIGDVLPLGLPTDHPLPLDIDGRHLADVRPARVGDQLACQVVRTALTAAGTDPVHRSNPTAGGLL